jgi:tetratricopeptide (TPR) repeat protein
LIDEDTDEALAAAMTATELDPEDARTWFSLATVYQARVRQARLDREKVLTSDFEAAEAALERAIEIEGPLSLFAHERARLISAWPGRVEEADALLRELIESPDAAPDVKEAAAATYFEYGMRRDDLAAVRLSAPILVEANQESIEAWEAWARVEETAERGAGEAVLREFVETRPADVRAYEHLGDYLAVTGKREEAVEFLESSARNFSEPSVLIARAVLVRMENNDRPGADVAYQLLAEEFPNAPHTRLVEARRAFDAGDFDQSAQIYRLLTSEIVSVEVFRYLSLSELYRRNIPGAEEAIRSAMSLRGIFDPSLARIRVRIRREARDWPRVSRVLRNIVRHGYPLRPNERVWLAEANYGLGNSELGRKQLEAILATEEPPIQAARLFVRFESRKDPEAATRVLQEAQVRHPGAVGLEVMEARLVANQGDLESARAIVDALIANSDSPPLAALLLRGQMRLAAKDLVGANEDARLVLDLDPGNASATGLMLQALSRADRVPELIATLEAENDAGKLELVGKRTLASLQNSIGNEERALQLYEEIFEAAPEDGWTMNALAYLLARRGESLDRALDLARGAVSQIPDNPQTVDTLGFVYLAKGLLEPALSQFDRAIEVVDEDNKGLLATLRAHRGVTLERLGRMADAEVEYALARELDPELDPAEQAPASAGT